jgi:hypothetical protein
MKRIRTWIALGAAAAIVGGVASAALASADRRTSARAQTLTFKPVTAESQDVDLDPAGPSIGDQHLFADDLLAEDGKRAGRSSELCTVARLHPEQWQCVTTLSVRRGQIAGQGVFTPGTPFQYAIVGGTGGYRGASGFVESSPEKIVLHIDRR